MIKTYLASASPRRVQLFKQICKEFTVAPSSVDESVPAGTTPEETVKILSERKAEVVYLKVKEDLYFDKAVVLGADTVVAFNGKILGKPKTEEEAFSILSALSGNTHEVFTGICMISDDVVKRQVVESKVTFRELSEQEIWDYIKSGSPMDKAGAYGIQDGVVVKIHEGSYTNIVGLPVEETEKMYEEVVKLLC